MGTVYATSNPNTSKRQPQNARPNKTETDKKLNSMGIDPDEPALGVDHPCYTGSRTETRTLSLQGISARVDRVHFDGVVRTKADVLKHSVNELFTAENFEDMIQKAHIVRGKLQNLGIFRNVAIHIDTSTGPKASPNGYEIIYEVVEMKRIFGGVTTQVANHGEAVLVVNGVMPNLFGRAESLKAEYTYGSNRTNTVGCSLIKPLLLKSNPVLTISGFKNDSEWPMSGYKVIDKAILLDLAWNSSGKLKQNVQYEVDWRQITAGNRYAAFEVRADAGHSLKSAIKYIATLDYRDSKVFPTCGNLLKFSNELSGLGGNVAFLKNEITWQYNHPICREHLVLQWSLNFGHMFDVKEESSAVCDNFFLGGPMSLRGFEFRSVGPANDSNFVGAKRYWSGGLHLYTPLPFKPGAGGFGDLFRTHFWINLGNCENWTFDNLSEFYKNQADNARIAAGLGLAFRLGQLARVEINYCFPLKSQESDKKVEGVQFGVGVHFV